MGVVVRVTVDAQAAREQAQALREEVRRQRLDYDGTADLEVVETAADMLDALAARLEAAEAGLRRICEISSDGDLWYPSERREEVEAAFADARASLAAGRGEHG